MLAGPLLLPPLLLAALLIVSGAAKLRHPEETRSAFSQLRLPGVLTDSPAPRALPWAELVLAAALLLVPAPFAVVVAVVALGLFLTYLVVIVRALGFGYPVTCSCFGRLGLGEVTRRTALRNVLLVLVALLTVWSTTADDSVIMRLLSASATTWVWLALVVLLAGVVVVTFGGAKGEPLASTGGAPTGESHSEPADTEPSDTEPSNYVRQPLPYAVLENDFGGKVTLHELVADGAVLLLFVSPGCGSCRPVIEKLAEWDQALGPVQVRAVIFSPIEEAVAAAPELAGRVLRDPDAITARIFRVGTPGAILMGGDGLLAGGPVQGAEVLEFYEDIRAELIEAGVIEADVVEADVVEAAPVTDVR